MISKGEMCAFKLLILVFTNAVFHVTFSYSVGCGGGGGEGGGAWGSDPPAFCSLFIHLPFISQLPPLSVFLPLPVIKETQNTILRRFFSLFLCFQP